MATSNLMSNLMTGDGANFNRGQHNIGMPVLNNSGTPSLNPSGPGGVATPIIGPVGTLPTNPVAPGATIIPPAGAVPINTGQGIIQPQSNPMFPAFGSSNPINSPVMNKIITANGGMPVQQAYANTGSVPTNVNNPGVTGQTPQQAQEEQKQLVDIYGKGTGNLLDTLINNIGGSDDAYMQAYAKAMAGPNAENLATLNTTLGNSGIGMNSSTAAIANADFESNITAQEGLQEQQLKLADEAQLQSLVSGMEGQSAKEVSSGGIGSILGSLISAIPIIGPAVGGAISQIGNTGGAAPFGSAGVGSAAGETGQGMINYESQPLGAGAIPLEGTDTSALPGISEEALQAADVFI